MTRTQIRLWIASLFLGVVLVPGIGWGVNYDASNSAMRVSLYGKKTVAGDTSLEVDSANNLKVIMSSATGSAANQIQGTAASGSAAVGNPVQIGGIQTSGTMQTIKVGPDGYLWVNLGASSSAIGSVVQGASASVPWYVTPVGPDGTRISVDARTPAVTNVAVGTTATQLTAAPPAKQVQACFQPMEAEARFGPAGVTWTDGWPLAASQSMCIDLYSSAAYYAVATPSTVNVRVMTTVSAN